MFLYSKPIFR